ncbi:MAG: PPC domain-containing protein, partial [Verrucomicrobiota bacterium]
MNFYHYVLGLLVATTLFTSASDWEKTQLRPGPTYRHIEPAVAQQGKEVTLTIYGTRLSDVKNILFYRPGIKFKSCTPLLKAYHKIPYTIQSFGPGQAIEVTLEIAADCPTGRHLFRVQTGEKLSELGALYITPYPCIEEATWWQERTKPVNDTIETAQPIQMGSSIYGYLPAGSVVDNDFYEIELEEGQHLTLEVWADALGYRQTNHDLALTVYGPDQKKIAESDDTVLGGQDPWLSIKAKKSGTHYVKTRQAMDMESHAMHYVLNVTSSVKGTLIYPLGGKAGTNLSAQLLDTPSGDQAVEISLPKEVGSFEESIIDYTFPSAQTAVVPTLVQVASFDNVLEDGQDHSTEAKAQVYSGDLPIAFNGKIDQEGQRDWFRFKAKKGDRYRVWTYAATLGSPIDVKLTLKAAEGLNSRVNISEDDSYFDDRDEGCYGKWASRKNLDPVFIFEPDQDGEYLLGIEDSQRMFGPDFAYRIE